jgi:hypothetical protein
MKLDRNVNADGQGKYALINLRKGSIKKADGRERNDGIRYYSPPETAIEWGDTFADEFFVIKLKDVNAHAALLAYAEAAMRDPGSDKEFAHDVHELAMRSGAYHPLCKKPD